MQKAYSDGVTWPPWPCYSGMWPCDSELGGGRAPSPFQQICWNGELLKNRSEALGCYSLSARVEWPIMTHESPAAPEVPPCMPHQKQFCPLHCSASAKSFLQYCAL